MGDSKAGGSLVAPLFNTVVSLLTSLSPPIEHLPAYMSKKFHQIRCGKDERKVYVIIAMRSGIPLINVSLLNSAWYGITY